MTVIKIEECSKECARSNHFVCEVWDHCLVCSEAKKNKIVIIIIIVQPGNGLFDSTTSAKFLLFFFLSCFILFSYSEQILMFFILLLDSLLFSECETIDLVVLHALPLNFRPFSLNEIKNSQRFEMHYTRTKP